jgi:hypothetical protein
MYSFLCVFFVQLRGVGAGEKVHDPVNQHARPVQVVAELVEVDHPPDKSPEPAREPHTHDIREGACGAEVDELS